MERKGKLLGYYNYTVILTYVGLLAGFSGILAALEGGYRSAMLCLMTAGFCDMFDGAIASTRKRTEQEKCFGIQIDSLCDLVCFGVLPAVLVYCMGQRTLGARCVAAFYVLCALIRLAFFNVDEQERQKRTCARRESYLGLPVTLSAIFVPGLYGAGNYFSWQKNPALPSALAVMGVMFLLPVPLKKPGRPGKLLLLCCGVLVFCLAAFA